MLDLRFAEISSSAGDMSDGIIRGWVNQSPLTGFFSNVLLAGTLYAFRRDRYATGTSYIDVSSLAVSGTTDALEPFGSTAAMSAGDGLLASLDAGHPYKVTAPQAGSLQTHADNAAAATAGLTIGQVYMTATGQLMVRY